MTDTAPPATPRPLLTWLLPTGLFTVVAIGILWALPRPAQPCIAIYPQPPECAVGDPSVIIPFLVILVLLFAAIVACAVLLTTARGLVLGLLSGALALVFVIGVFAALQAAVVTTVIY